MTHPKLEEALVKTDAFLAKYPSLSQYGVLLYSPMTKPWLRLRDDGRERFYFGFGWYGHVRILHDLREVSRAEFSYLCDNSDLHSKFGVVRSWMWGEFDACFCYRGWTNTCCFRGGLMLMILLHPQTQGEITRMIWIYLYWDIVKRLSFAPFNLRRLFFSHWTVWICPLFWNRTLKRTREKNRLQQGILLHPLLHTHLHRNLLPRRRQTRHRPSLLPLPRLHVVQGHWLRKSYRGYTVAYLLGCLFVLFDFGGNYCSFGG